MRTNYTTSFSSVDDRFNYKRRGIFRCRNSSEVLYIYLFTAAMTLFLAIVFLVSIYADANLASILFTLLFDLLKTTAILWYPMFLIAGIRLIRSGVQYSFTADEEKMLIVCPKLEYRADIIYKNVLNVEYKKTFFFGKQRGFDVTIYSKDGTYFYNFLFPQNIHIKHEDMTPFRIIEERAGLLEKPEFMAGRRIDNAGIYKE